MDKHRKEAAARTTAMKCCNDCGRLFNHPNYKSCTRCGESLRPLTDADKVCCATIWRNDETRCGYCGSKLEALPVSYIKEFNK